MEFRRVLFRSSRVAISPDDHSMGRFQSIFEGRGSGSVISMVLVDSLEVAWTAMRANCHNRSVRLPSEFALRIRAAFRAVSCPPMQRGSRGRRGADYGADRKSGEKGGRVDVIVVRG